MRGIRRFYPFLNADRLYRDLVRLAPRVSILELTPNSDGPSDSPSSDRHCWGN